MSETRVKAAIGKQVYVDAPDSHEIGGAIVVSWSHDGTVSASLLGETSVVVTKMEIGGFHEFSVELLAKDAEEDWR